MPFIHRNYNTAFLNHLKTHTTPILPDPKYQVRLVPATVAEGEVYWRVIGIHHLLPEENWSNRNIFFDVLDENGNRIKSPIIWAGWTWEGRQPHEQASPTPLDKPDNETAGNISVGSNQKVSVWIKGTSRDGEDKSDKVEGLHTVHPDEVLPDGRKLNTIGHHSFYVVFQRTRKVAGGPVVVPPVVVPQPVPVPVPQPTPAPDPRPQPVPVPTPQPLPVPPRPGLFTEEEWRKVREAIEIVLGKVRG